LLVSVVSVPIARDFRLAPGTACGHAANFKACFGSIRRKYCTRKGGEPDDECFRPLMVTLILVADLSWAGNILVRSIVSASNERNGAPSGNKPQDISALLRSRQALRPTCNNSIMPTRSITLGKDKVSGSRHRLIVVSDQGLRRFSGSAAVPLVDRILPR
jgi:hypothetical protein